MQTLYELLVRSATLPALHTNNGGATIMQQRVRKCVLCQQRLNDFW
jgi:hypothetical protein